LVGSIGFNTIGQKLDHTVIRKLKKKTIGELLKITISIMNFAYTKKDLNKKYK
jgi:hypothetical protein